MAARLTRLAAEDTEVAEYVQTLEEARDTAELPEASGEAIAREFERYLRRRDGGQPGQPGGHATADGSDSTAYLRDSPGAGRARPPKAPKPETGAESETDRDTDAGTGPGTGPDDGDSPSEE